MPEKSLRRFGRILVAILYVLCAMRGVVEVAIPGSGILEPLFSVLLAWHATAWCVSDAERRLQPLLAVLPMLIYCAWPIAVPIYLVRTRRLRGLGLALLHVLGLILTFGVFFVGTTLARYGARVFAGM